MIKSKFILIALLCAAATGLPLPAAAQNPEADAWALYQQQAQEEARLKQEAWAKYEKEQAEEARRKEASWATWDQQVAKDAEHQARFDKLLTRWEEQAARYDRILDAMEKQAGLAQTTTPPVQPEPLELYSFRFADASLAQVLPVLHNLTGKTVVADPGLVNTFTLDSMEKVTAAEGLALIKDAFARQGLSLVEGDAGTLRVVLRPRDPS